MISAGATTSYLDLALHLVDRYAGHPVAVATAKVLAVDKNRLTQRPYFLFADQREHGDSTVLQGAGPDRAAPPRRGGHPAARRALRDERANTEGRHLEWAVEIALLIAANAPLAVQAAPRPLVPPSVHLVTLRRRPYWTGTGPYWEARQ